MQDNEDPILSGENTLQVLADNGVDPATCNQTCHLSMAREIKAEKFISGAVQWTDGEFTASIRLLDTATGQILATESLEGENVRTLRNDFKAKVRDFFTKGGMLSAEAAAMSGLPAAPAPDAGPRSAAVTHAQNVSAEQQSRMKILTEPQGATVIIDGETIGKTPLKMPMAPGTYRLQIELPKYAPVALDIDVIKFRETYHFETLGAPVRKGAKTFQAAGLEWQQVPSAEPMDQPASLKYCEKLALADSVWRLPSDEELKALYESRASRKDVSNVPGIGSGTYWSAGGGSFDFGTGSAYAVDTARVRCVH
jgi:hypothetical protein